MIERKINKTLGTRKVAIIGTGFVGSSIAYALALRDIVREVVLIDINQERAAGEALDIRHGLPIMGTTDLYVGDYSDCSDCDLIVVTAGRGRKKGESRLDLINDNVSIIREVVESIKKYYTRGVLLVISNPVDILTYKVDEWMGLPNGMVLGSGCILDTSRFVRTVSDYIGLNTGVVNGYMVGEHGDTQIPIWSKVNVAGIPIDEYCAEMNLKWDEEVRQELTRQTITMGADIIKAKGKTHYGIATCVCCIADAIINMRPIIASVSSRLMGEHGVRDVALSVPSLIGPAGVQQRIREKWTPEEYGGFFASVEKVREVLKILE